MGTAHNEDQLRYLKRYTRHIMLALDPDAAGEKATLRGLELARLCRERLDAAQQQVNQALAKLDQPAGLQDMLKQKQQEIAAAALYLCSPGARMVTGIALLGAFAGGAAAGLASLGAGLDPVRVAGFGYIVAGLGWSAWKHGVLLRRGRGGGSA